MSKDRTRKPTDKLNVRPADSQGQQPFWPGEDRQMPGTIEDNGETTTIPVVDSVQQPTKNQTNE